MASTFLARNSAGSCGLCAQAVDAGDTVFYLTCAGDRADANLQAIDSPASEGYPTGYRAVSVPDSSGATRWDPRTRSRVPKTVYVTEERSGAACNACVSAQSGQGRMLTNRRTGQSYRQRGTCTCRWTRLAVWSRLVHADCASVAGFRVPGRSTEARPGKRDTGAEHRAADPTAVVVTRADDATLAVARAWATESDPVADEMQRDRDASRPTVGATLAETVGALNANVATVQRNAERDPSGRPGRYPSLENAYADERAAAIAARERAANERATPVPAPAPVSPDNVPADVEDVAAYKRFACLELD